MNNLVQLYSCLQPLMLCLSHRETLDVVDRVSADFDIKIKEWVNKVSINEKHINVIPTFQVNSLLKAL